MKKHLYFSFVLLLILMVTLSGCGGGNGRGGSGSGGNGSGGNGGGGNTPNLPTIITIAGTGTAGYDKNEDNGPATSAKLNSPWGVAVDSNRNLYIADTNNHCIRKVDLTSNNISVIAGSDSGTPDYSGDGGQATDAKLAVPSGVAVDSQGNIYIAEYYNNCIRKVNSEGIISTFVGNKGSAIYADLKGPRGVAIDSDGNIYIADTDNHRVLKVISPNNN